MTTSEIRFENTNTFGNIEFLTGAANTVPSVKLSILNTGEATFASSVTANGFYQVSDIRYKNLVDREYDESVLRIKAITYTWKDLKQGNKKQIGYSAQEVQKILPDAVEINEEGFLSVNYIQVLVAKIEELENRLKQLEHGI